MAHLSKTPLEPKQLEDLFLQFNRTISNLDSEGVDVFFGELLGDEERIMLAKRFAAILLLAEGASVYRVANILKLSPSTVDLLNKKYQSGKFKSFSSNLKKKKKDYLSLLNTVDQILHLGGILPRYNEKDRWKGRI